MPIPSVRLSAEEEAILKERAKNAGVKKATFVRNLIGEEQILTTEDLGAWAARHEGDKRFRIRVGK